ncbi:ribosome maturation factor RimP [Pelomonas sp. PFR6]|uniref:Ribosome maturation factor RimP n=1 Tax=Roseateles violae TaxID=3058042 RepID=A0ABT8DW35_9BURK|nr:ribosome maturation factor RimP [Pelomonas sp. PFR6]MDN3920504.1 ribosome maturation factor RimP [Pelomonas sp. PFR6]
MNWQASVETTVTGLGYELVDCERSAAGLLRVYIDKLPEAAAAGELINVDDCERVTRQLQYVLEVENVPYERLEVSSPGMDRPLRKEADYVRFAGQEVALTLKQPFQGRKKYQGVLSAQPAELGQGWRIVFGDGEVEQAMDFSLEEVREARLVPVSPFKGRNSGKKPAPAKKKSGGAAKKKTGAAALGRKTDDKVHGGLDQ